MYGGANRSGSAIEKIVFYLEYPEEQVQTMRGSWGSTRVGQAAEGMGGKRLYLQGVLSI